MAKGLGKKSSIICLTAVVFVLVALLLPLCLINPAQAGPNGEGDLPLSKSAMKKIAAQNSKMGLHPNELGMMKLLGQTIDTEAMRHVDETSMASNEAEAMRFVGQTSEEEAEGTGDDTGEGEDESGVPPLGHTNRAAPSASTDR